MRIIYKTWGHEEIIVNKEYCGKLLFLRNGYQCSLHYHKKKAETFYILKGKVLLEYGKKKRIMKIGDHQDIRRNMKHRFSGIEDSIIVEFSTRDFKSDSYRLSKSKKI